MPPGERKALPVETMRHAFAYVFARLGHLLQCLRAARGPDRERRLVAAHRAAGRVDNRSLILFDRGDEVVVQGGENGIRFLLCSGQAARRARRLVRPIVMNTQAELREAFDELERGTFLRPDATR